MTALSQLVDYHLHTDRCGHARGTIEQYLARAREIGLGEVGFSEHIFMYWLPNDQRDPELGMPEERFPEYIEAVRAAQESQSEVRVRLGLEVDYVPGWERQLTEVLERERWDYLLGSVHFIDSWGFDDPRYVDQYANWDVDVLYERYFELVMAAAGSGLFDIMAHLDLPKKFGHRPQRDLLPMYDRVAATLKRTDVCVEVSTAGLRKPVGEMYPAPLLLDACFRAGVPATVSSDAHRPEELGMDYAEAMRLLREVGYTEIAVFQARRRTFRKLP